MADIHPIVIAPLEHVHKSIKFTCSGQGLHKDGWPYDAHPEKFIASKSKKAGVEPKALEKKPVAYWKVQCAFRGLNQSGAISDLQLRLREAKKKILPELKTAETELNKEFKKKNKAAKDGTWRSCKTVEEKAKADPTKFLAEAFPKTATGRPTNLDIVVVKSDQDVRFALAKAAENVQLETVSVDAPRIGKKKPNPDRWIIIGRTKDAVWNQMRDIEGESSGTKTIIHGDEPNVKKVKLSKPARKQTASRSTTVVATPTVQSSSSAAAASKDTKGKNAWDVRGSWEISCSEIEEQWGAQGDPSLTLNIFLEQSQGKRQLFAVFDFRVVTGVMRFEKPAPASKSSKASSSLGKRTRDDFDEEGDVTMQDIDTYSNDDANENYTDQDFFLGAKDQPTARRPTWRYRWRGEETGEGEIQHGSDTVVQHITFDKKGDELSGTFKCDFIGECTFTGVKTSKQSALSRDPKGQWLERGEDAYGYASQARWR